MANKDFNIRIRVDDGKAKVQIDGLTEGFVNVETAVSKLNAELNNNQAAMEGTAKWYKQQISLLKEQRDKTAKTAEEYARQTKAIEKVQIKYRELSSDVSQFNKVNEDQISNAGLAGATLTELGRTVSDLPYGIRGIANNLSQLSTLFITLTAKTKGFSNSIGLLLKQLRGPLGFVLAFQAVISLLDFFSQKTSKATDDVDGLTDALKDETAALIIAARLFETGALTAEQNAEVISKLNEEYDGLNLRLDEFGNVSSDSIDQLDKFTEEAIRAAVVQSTLADIIELAKQKAVEQQRALDKGKSTLDSFKMTIRALTGQIGTKGLFNVFATNAEKSAENISDLNDQIEALKATITDEELLNALKGIFPSEDDKDEEGVQKERVKRLRGFYEEAFNIFDAFNMRQNEQTEFDKSLVDAIVKNAQTGNDAFAAFSKKFLAEQKAIDDQQKEIHKKEKERLKEKKELIKTLQTLSTMALEAINSQFDAEVSIEERRTVIANNALRERLNNEKLSAKEKENINDQIAANEEALQRKRDKIAEKNFKLQKTVAIAQALISTYEMANDAFGTIKGMKILGPAALPLAIAAAATATALGLANVDAIRRTQFVPSATGDAGGGGGGGAGVQAPDFNIVGVSAQSQLAETVATAESQPVRAYVVGKDVSTQQELDRNITNTASFG